MENENTLNLVPAIKEIERQISEMETEFSKKIEPYRSSLAELRRINTACEVCGGKGLVLRTRSCAEDDRPDPSDPRDFVKCGRCFGSGLAHPDYPTPICSG